MSILENLLLEKTYKWRYYVLALAWLMLMFFFTYTAIISEAMMLDKSLIDAHWINQCSFISLFINCGLLSMIVFDYLQPRREITHAMILFIFLGLFLALGIYGHTSIIEDNRLHCYDYPLKWKPLSLWLHLFFLFVLLWLKEKAIEQDLIHDAEIVIAFNK